MLIINEELLAIDQAIECLVSYFLKLPEVENYRLKRQKFENDRELQEQLFAFQELKDSYDAAKAYEAFRPDVRELKRQVLRMKRQIDLNEVVIAYRHAEFDLQTILANLGEEIAQAVSGIYTTIETYVKLPSLGMLSTILIRCVMCTFM